ncbi:MAG: extracellular solute-binding protein [Gemmatimonadales bacterium]|nr:extracellular solute-binding protein [Gemmatimonadales bacterium]
MRFNLLHVRTVQLHRGLTTMLVLAAALGFSAGCGGDGREPLLVYTPHGRDQLQLLEQAFEAQEPGIDLRWLDMGSQEILDRLRFERQNTQADVWFGGPSTIFDRGIEDSLLVPYRPAWAGAVGPEGIAPGDLYYPAYRTPAVIAYNNTALSADEVPHDWDEVLDGQWAGKILIRDPMASGTMRAIWGLIIQRSLRITGDTAAAMDWLRRLDAHTKTYTLNPAILVEKLSRQEGLLTVWGLQDILFFRSQGAPFGYVFPRSGTVVIEDAVGLVRGARHPEAAKRFIDFVGSREAQLLAARGVFRLPARHDLPLDSVPDWVSEVEQNMIVAPMDWEMLAREGPGWMSYWDQRVRGTGKTLDADPR